MPSKGLSGPLKAMSSTSRHCTSCSRPALHPSSRRSMATEAPLPTLQSLDTLKPELPHRSDVPSHLRAPSVLTTIYRFPTMEPLRFASYPSEYLNLPLRRDILHKAVIYEGDRTRQGGGHAKHRSEIAHGSSRKLHAQKGTGKARVGDAKSPIRVGGGKAHGPKPRDFSTGLPRKMYDLAWRTALSYRYHRGELIVVDDEYQDPARWGLQHINDKQRAVWDAGYKGNWGEQQRAYWREIQATFALNKRYMLESFLANGWGNADGRSTVLTDKKNLALVDAMKDIGRHGQALDYEDVDVKDLLSLGRIIVEKTALYRLLVEHRSDLQKTRRKFGAPSFGAHGEENGEMVEYAEEQEIPAVEQIDPEEEAAASAILAEAVEIRQAEAKV